MTKIFRAPAEALDEITPDLTPKQWAQGGGKDHNCESCMRSTYRTYYPGEIVDFVATEELGQLEYVYGETSFEGPPPPAGYTWVSEAEDFENSASSLEDLYKHIGELGGDAGGETFTLRFQCDTTEYWRCVGSYGQVSTYDFAPSSLTEKIAAIVKELESFDFAQPMRRQLMNRAPAPISAAELKDLLRHVLKALGDQKPMTPVLIAEGRA